MPKRRDVVAEQLRALADDIDELWKAVTRDPQREARRERAWAIVSGAAGVVATMAVRRALVKLWPILTGESPPMPRPGEPATTAAPTAEAPAQAEQREPEVAPPEPQPAEPEVTQAEPPRWEPEATEAEAPTQTIPSASATAER